MNVLKSHKKAAVVTLLECGLGQREVQRLTGVNLHTIRAIGRQLALGVGKTLHPVHRVGPARPRRAGPTGSSSGSRCGCAVTRCRSTRTWWTSMGSRRATRA